VEIKCILCGEPVTAPDDLVAGQHVRCPICGGKFSYAPGGDAISEDDLRTALGECRKDPEMDRYYSEAPEGARLYIALEFYGRVFKGRMNVDAYVKAFSELGTELKEADLVYLLQHEEDETMRKYLTDRLKAVGVEIEGQELRSKTVRKPRLGIIRDNPSRHPAPETVDVIDVQVVPHPVAQGRIAQEQSKTWISANWRQVALVAAASAAVVLVLAVIVANARTSRRITETEPTREVAERREEIPVSSSEKVQENSQPTCQESDRKRLQEDFAVYLRREREVLEGVVRESTAAYEEIVGDQLKLSKLMGEIDAENSRREMRALTNGWIRFEKPEVVMMVLKDKGLNALAMKYIGEDFSALCNECRGRIKSEMQLHAEHERLLAENRRKYQQKVAGIDDDVEKKNIAARKLRNEANRMFANRINALKTKLSNQESALAEMKASRIKNRTLMDECTVAEAEITGTRNEIAKMEELIASGRASSAHITATEAENMARRRGDSALEARQDDDNAVQVRMDNIRSLFAISVNFEERSLDRVRAAMQSRKETLSVRMADAKARLDVINNASANVDMMDLKQLEEVKRRIGTKIGDSIVGGDKGGNAR